MMSEKLRLVGRHIDRNRAVTLASFARQTEVKRGLHIFVLPFPANHIALSHLPEQMRAAASGMLFLPSHAEAGAHDAALILAALAHTYTAQRRFR